MKNPFKGKGQIKIHDHPLSDEEILDIVWDDLGQKEITHAVLYAEPNRPRGWSIFNPMAWIRYWRGEGELLAYWDMTEEQDFTIEWKDAVEIDWRTKE